MVSLVGNLVLMKVLVAGVRQPAQAANGMAILCCSLVNFCLGEAWVFGAKRLRAKEG